MIASSYIARFIGTARYFVVLLLCICATTLVAQTPSEIMPDPDIPDPSAPILQPYESTTDSIVSSFAMAMDTVTTHTMLIDSTAIVTDSVATAIEVSTFDPDAMRAVWLSALCPGLGQIYNRRYWKLPIVVGGFAGLIYATTWNGRMLSDYQQAYLDVMDTDPNTNSYMDFFPPYYTEDMIDQSWLKNVLKTRKDAYRHYRDYCIVGMVALYLVCILDAYVDAEMYHFDMSSDLSMEVKPALIPISPTQQPALGLQCAITF